MALIATQLITDAGVTTTWQVLATTSNTFTNSGKEFIGIKMAAEASDVTVTVTTQVTEVETTEFGTLTKSNSSKAVGGGDIIFIGPFPVGAFATAEGVTTFTVSSTTNVTAAVFSYE
jgi:hypothetical protein|tara:strand:- start:1234 stop:1584 length:351 start_codon:yes stop_codon:yes gene_type:complete